MNEVYSNFIDSIFINEDPLEINPDISKNFYEIYGDGNDEFLEYLYQHGYEVMKLNSPEGNELVIATPKDQYIKITHP